MKHIIKFIFFSLAFSACKKDMPSNNDNDIPYFDFEIYFPGIQNTGNAQAKVFDKIWNATAHITRFPKDTSRHFEVYFETYSEEGFTRDQISFGVFDGKVGEYSVTDNHFDNNFDDRYIACKYNFWISDGDLLYGNYLLDTKFENIIIIDKNDGEFVEGRFSLLFNLNGGENYTDIPRRIYFKEGKFKVKL